MQKFILTVAMLSLLGCGAFQTKGPPSAPGPLARSGSYAVFRSGIDGISAGDFADEIPASGTLTEKISRGSVLNDSLLTGNTDVQLLDLEYSATFMIEITHGDYTISLVPPSGEKLRRETTFQTANYEMDLSSDEGDVFILKRIYSDSETDWTWQVGAWFGTLADGGAAD